MRLEVFILVWPGFVDVGGSSVFEFCLELGRILRCKLRFLVITLSSSVVRV